MVAREKRGPRGRGRQAPVGSNEDGVVAEREREVARVVGAQPAHPRERERVAGEQREWDRVERCADDERKPLVGLTGRDRPGAKISEEGARHLDVDEIGYMGVHTTLLDSVQPRNGRPVHFVPDGAHERTGVKDGRDRSHDQPG